jgi:hypothetical protein
MAVLTKVQDKFIYLHRNDFISKLKLLQLVTTPIHMQLCAGYLNVSVVGLP